MRFIRSRIEGVISLEFDRHTDERGSFMRSFCAQEFADAGLKFDVAQTNVSTNLARHTLRGLHFQRAPHGEAKLVTCVRGQIFDVAVDVRKGSPTYLEWQAFELSESSPIGLYLCQGIAHGFLTLESDTIIHYLMEASYFPTAAEGLRWDDPTIHVRWPADPKVISERDRNFPLLH